MVEVCLDGRKGSIGEFLDYSYPIGDLLNVGVTLSPFSSTVVGRLHGVCAGGGSEVVKTDGLVGRNGQFHFVWLITSGIDVQGVQVFPVTIDFGLHIQVAIGVDFAAHDAAVAQTEACALAGVDHLTAVDAREAVVAECDGQFRRAGELILRFRSQFKLWLTQFDVIIVVYIHPHFGAKCRVLVVFAVALHLKAGVALIPGFLCQGYMGSDLVPVTRFS